MSTMKMYTTAEYQNLSMHCTTTSFKISPYLYCNDDLAIQLCIHWNTFRLLWNNCYCRINTSHMFHCSYNRSCLFHSLLEINVNQSRSFKLCLYKLPYKTILISYMNNDQQMLRICSIKLTDIIKLLWWD